jgi:hypothetical protein
MGNHAPATGAQRVATPLTCPDCFEAPFCAPPCAADFQFWSSGRTSFWSVDSKSPSRSPRAKAAHTSLRLLSCAAIAPAPGAVVVYGSRNVISSRCTATGGGVSSRTAPFATARSRIEEYGERRAQSPLVGVKFARSAKTGLSVASNRPALTSADFSTTGKGS